MLTDNQVKERLALAYIYAIAARVRCSCDIPSADMDSIDMRLTMRNEDDAAAPLRSPEICLQVKAWPLAELKGPHVPYFLKKKNHDDLVKRTVVPRILVVVILPRDEQEWLSCTEDQLVLKRCAYWLNLRGVAPTTNQTGETVHVPRSQIFDPDALTQLMRQTAYQELQT